MRLVLLPLLALLSMPTPVAAAHEVYVSNEKDNTVSVIDSRTLAVTRTIPVGKRPRGIAFSADFKHLFVCASDSDAVAWVTPDEAQGYKALALRALVPACVGVP